MTGKKEIICQEPNSLIQQIFIEHFPGKAEFKTMHNLIHIIFELLVEQYGLAYPQSTRKIACFRFAILITISLNLTCPFACFDISDIRLYL